MAMITEPDGAYLDNAHVANAYEPVASSGPAARGIAPRAAGPQSHVASGGRSTGARLMTDGDQTGALVEG
jgi:hypothetical protein